MAIWMTLLKKNFASWRNNFCYIYILVMRREALFEHATAVEKVDTMRGLLVGLDKGIFPEGSRKIAQAINWFSEKDSSFCF